MQTRTAVIIASIAGMLAGAAAIGTAGADHRNRGGDSGWHGGGHKHGEMRRHHRRHGMKKRIRRFMKRYDANKDGQISQDEINTNRTEWHKTHDADSDGTLTIAEFEKLWLQAHRRRMVRAFQHLDEDGSGTITLGEYTEPMAHVVERMDRNGDGVLSRADRRGRKGRKGRRHGRSNDSDEN